MSDIDVAAADLPETAQNFDVAGYHGSVAPGVWSFHLAARARGLGRPASEITYFNRWKQTIG